MRWNFRLRTLLVAVAIVSAICGMIVRATAERRRVSFRQRAESFAYGEADVIDQIADKLASARREEAEGPAGLTRAALLRLEAEKLARVAAWHVKMERRYARAAEHPWEPLAPVPPQP